MERVLWTSILYNPPSSRPPDLQQTPASTIRSAHDGSSAIPLVRKVVFDSGQARQYSGPSAAAAATAAAVARWEAGQALAVFRSNARLCCLHSRRAAHPVPSDAYECCISTCNTPHSARSSLSVRPHR